ncbi:MAG: Tfp pilus assembly protein FimT/FimU [Candidatus Competibacter sp.]
MKSKVNASFKVKGVMAACLCRLDCRKGFTLLELIVTLALAALVLTVGVPNFQALIQDNRQTAAINQLVGALGLARSEAVKRNIRVTLCKSADGRCCTVDGGYQQGWIVFADSNGDAIRDPTTCRNSPITNDPEPIIRVHGPLEAGLTLIGSAGVSDYVSFIPVGASQARNGGFQAGTVTLCAPRYLASARRLVLSRGGRVRVERMVPAATAGC